MANRPWESSTGPRTEEGKARSAANVRTRQKGKRSIRSIKAELSGVAALVGAMQELRDEIAIQMSD